MPPPTGQRFRTRADGGERILRGEYGYSGAGIDWQLSAEAAFNYLDTRLDDAALQVDGSYLPRPLDDPGSRVEERRAEANLSASWPLAPALTAQGSLGAEYSELSQSGSAGQRREFVRPKGFIALAWRAMDDLDLSFKAALSIGQLKFSDFSASLDLVNDTSSAGNSELVPQQSWDLSLEIAKQFSGYGALKVSLTDRRIQDLVDQVPVGLDRTATGNIDSAHQFIVDLTGTLAFDRLGWAGAKLDLHETVGSSDVADPLTQADRTISGSQMFATTSVLRWDIPSTDWAAAAGFQDSRLAPTYRLSAIDQAWTDPAGSYVYVENKNVFGLKGRITFVNLVKVQQDFRRIAFDGRRPGPLLFIEERQRSSPFGVKFMLSGAF